MAILMSGKQLLVAGQMAMAVRSVAAELSVNTLPLPADILQLLLNSVTRTRELHMTTLLGASRL